MELHVEVVHGADSSTDVVLDVEPAATFGDVADSLTFLRTIPNGGTLQVARTGQTPRRDDRVADVDVRSGDRLTLVDSINAAFSVTPEAFGATLAVTAPTGAETEYPLRYRRQLTRSRPGQRRRHQGPPGVPPPRPHHGQRRDHDRRPRLEERDRRRRRGDRHADDPASGPDRPARRPDVVDPQSSAAPSKRSPRTTGSSSTGRRASTGPTAASRSRSPPRRSGRAGSGCR